MTNLEVLVGESVPDEQEAMVGYALRVRCGEMGAKLADALSGTGGASAPSAPSAADTKALDDLGADLDESLRAQAAATMRAETAERSLRDAQSINDGLSERLRVAESKLLGQG